MVSYPYADGTRRLRLAGSDDPTTSWTLSERWHQSRLCPDHQNMIVVGDLLLSSSGYGPSFLIAADLESGEIAWRQRRPKTVMVRNGPLVLAVEEDGDLVLMRPDREGPNEILRTAVLRGRAWTPPSLVGQELYLRDAAELVALDLGF